MPAFRGEAPLARPCAADRGRPPSPTWPPELICAAVSRDASDGWMRITDAVLADAINCSWSVVRRVRKKILNAHPPFDENHLEGITGRAYEYKIRRTTTDDKVPPAVSKRFAANQPTNRPDRRLRPIHTHALNQALLFKAEGMSVIPIQPREKKPAIRWTPFSTRRASSLEIQAWFRKWPAANVGVVTGSVSNIVIVDIDGDREQGSGCFTIVGCNCPRHGS